jgi:hypothetical protein
MLKTFLQQYRQIADMANPYIYRAASVRNRVPTKAIEILRILRKPDAAELACGFYDGHLNREPFRRGASDVTMQTRLGL